MQVSALNLSYSDNGLFGIFLSCEPSDTEKVRVSMVEAHWGANRLQYRIVKVAHVKTSHLDPGWDNLNFVKDPPVDRS